MLSGTRLGIVIYVEENNSYRSVGKTRFFRVQAHSDAYSNQDHFNTSDCKNFFLRANAFVCAGEESQKRWQPIGLYDNIRGIWLSESVRVFDVSGVYWIYGVLENSWCLGF